MGFISGKKPPHFAILNFENVRSCIVNCQNGKPTAKVCFPAGDVEVEAGPPSGIRPQYHHSCWSRRVTGSKPANFFRGRANGGFDTCRELHLLS
jgi:hypothetical protein